MARSRTLRFAAALGLALAFTGPASATPPTEAQVDRLIEVLEMREQYPQIQQQFLAAMEQQLLTEFQPKSARERRDLERGIAIIREEVGTALAWDVVLPIYRRVFLAQYTAEELEAAIEFYGSPHGRSMVRKQPAAISQVFTELQPLMEQEMQGMGERVKARLEAGDGR